MIRGSISRPEGNSSTLAKQFANYFILQQVCSPDQFDEIYKMRYQTYCEEFDYDIYHHNQRERDEYDRFSLQCLLRLQSNQAAAGSVRIIIPPKQKRGMLLPFERNFHQAFYRNLMNSYGQLGDIEKANFYKSKMDQLNGK